MEITPSSELSPAPLGFPNEFPYEFDSPGFTSPGDSTETEDESTDDEEDFLAELSRRLAPSTQRLPPPPPTPPSFNTKPEEKRCVAVTSPQSTLSGLGSFSKSRSGSTILLPSSLPTTSLTKENALDVISAAAGEVAKLKLGCNEPHIHRQNPNRSPILRQKVASLQTDRFIQQQRLLDQIWLCSQSRVNHLENLRYNALRNATWLPQHAGTPQKRTSTGTGVFLPRKYPSTTYPSDSLKKPVASMVQSKVNPHQNLKFDEFSNVGSRRSRFDYECMFAKSTLLGRQGDFREAVGGVCCLNQERRLPQDWMY